MAPSRSSKDDDFVFTLSDNEDAPRFDDEEDKEMLGDAPTDNKKRKREVEAPKPKNKKQKQQEKQQLKNAKKNKKNAAPEPESEEEDNDAAEDATEDDGVLNPEFEFDVGGVANQGVTEGFDGWGAADEQKKSGDKKAVDI